MKNKYVVALFSQHAGTLNQEIIEAKTRFEAMKEYMQSEALSQEQLEEELEGADMWITALQINNLTKIIPASPGAIFLN